MYLLLRNNKFFFKFMGWLNFMKKYFLASFRMALKARLKFP